MRASANARGRGQSCPSRMPSRIGGASPPSGLGIASNPKGQAEQLRGHGREKGVKLPATSMRVGMSRTLDEHLFGPGPKRILSLDGGGVRGLITLGLLKRVEDLLAARSADPRAFRLSDYFDLIGGTSTGAIIATLLAFGQRVDDVTKLYFDLCPQVFSRRTLLSYVFLSPRFDSAAFRRVIDATFDQILVEGGQGGELTRQQRLVAELTLGSPLVHTRLVTLMTRVAPRSLQPHTTNPPSKSSNTAPPSWRAIYEAEPKCDAVQFHPHRHHALRPLVRPTASAPFYLDAVEVPITKSDTG